MPESPMANIEYMMSVSRSICILYNKLPYHYCWKGACNRYPKLMYNVLLFTTLMPQNDLSVRVNTWII